MAVGTLEDGMTELAQQIVKNSLAKGKKSIAVSTFQHINGDQSELSNYLADELVLKLFSVPDANLEIIERGQLNKIFQEMQFNMTGVVDSKTIQQLGKVHGVGALVLGSVTEMGESVRVNARLIDTETGRVFSAAGTTISKTATIADLLSHIIVVADHGGSKKSLHNKSANSSTGVISKNSNRRRNGKSETYKVDLKQYDIGDMPEELGMVTVENGKGHVGKRVLKGLEGNYLKTDFPSVLKKNFEISFSGHYMTHAYSIITLFDKEGNKIEWKFEGYNGHWANIILDKTKHKLIDKVVISGKTPIKYTLESKGRVLKLFNNGKFIISKIHDASVEYTSLKIAFPEANAEITEISFTQK